MISKPHISSLVLTLFICASLIAGANPVPAQSLPQVQESKEEQLKAQQELERKALALLDTTLDNAQVLKLPENRALVQSYAADLLWSRDEKRARTLFRDAISAITDLFNGQQPPSRYDNSYWMAIELRREILQLIARRDPQLALDLLHASRPAQDENAETRSSTANQELALEQVIASMVADRDPKLALQMAQESLDKGISYPIIGLLQRLQEKDPEAASRLASDIIRKLQSNNVGKTNREAVWVAQELLRRATTTPERMAAQLTSPGQTPQKMKQLKLDDQALHDLSDAIATIALSTSTASDMGSIMGLQSLMPELEKRVPERAAQLRKKLSEVEKGLEPEAREWMRNGELMRNGTAEELLERAPKVSPEMRHGLYTMAAMKLAAAGDLDRARQIANDNFNGSEREQLLAGLDRQLITRAVEQGKLDDAKQLISRLRSNEARARELSFLAGALAVKGDRKTALQLLGEAQNLVNRQPENQEQLNALVQIASVYTLVEPTRAFDLIEPVIDQANEMLAAAALLEKFGAGRLQGGPGPALFRKGEMLFNPGTLSMERINMQYGRNVAALARADFEHTKSLADRFQRNEARIMARMVIAQSILSDRFANQGNNAPGLFMGSLLLGN